MAHNLQDLTIKAPAAVAHVYCMCQNCNSHAVMVYCLWKPQLSPALALSQQRNQKGERSARMSPYTSDWSHLQPFEYFQLRTQTMTRLAAAYTLGIRKTVIVRSLCSRVWYAAVSN